MRWNTYGSFTHARIPNSCKECKQRDVVNFGANASSRRQWLSAGIGLLAFLLAFALVARIPLFQILSPINLMVQALIFRLLGGLMVVGVLVAIDLRWPRVWCRIACPVGKLYFAVGRIAPLRVRIRPEPDGKRFCQQCTLQCPMQIRIMEDYACHGRMAVTDPQCIRCGACLEGCPGGVLRLEFRNHRSR